MSGAGGLQSPTCVSFQLELPFQSVLPVEGQLTVVLINEYRLLSVKNHVPELMKDREPEVVVALVLK